MVKMQIQLSYTFKEKVFFFGKTHCAKNLSYFSQAAFSLNFGVKTLSVCSTSNTQKHDFWQESTEVLLES